MSLILDEIDEMCKISICCKLLDEIYTNKKQMIRQTNCFNKCYNYLSKSQLNMIFSKAFNHYIYIIDNMSGIQYD